ncbi:YybS family protein [Bacillus sp. Marseille-P3661]|uniref:YybS family protein n=1 Tax=Bacillus sp. Marseille-P3661 TaxID=1936234 RepID=UPI000C842986|nr:YybS family protein [Bacillus sp. Marseille-P3661]
MNQIRAITEGSILIALYSIFLLAVLYLPLLGTFFIFALPLPFIIYVVRHSLKKAFLILIVALFITYIIGTVASLPMTFMFGTTGMVMGYIYSLKKGAFPILIGGTLSYIFNLILVFIVTVLIFDINFIEDTKKMLTESIKTAESILSATGQPNGQTQLLYESIEMVSYMIPSAIVITSIVLAFVTQLIANRVLKRLKFDLKAFPPLRDWQFPKSLLWYYLIVTLLFMIGIEEGTTLFMIVMNLFMVLELFMMLQGFVLIYYFCHMKGYSVGIPITIMIISFLIPFLLSIIRILGIIDLGFDLRKRMKNPQ